MDRVGLPASHFHDFADGGPSPTVAREHFENKCLLGSRARHAIRSVVIWLDNSHEHERTEWRLSVTACR